MVSPKAGNKMNVVPYASIERYRAHPQRRGLQLATLAVTGLVVAAGVGRALLGESTITTATQTGSIDDLWVTIAAALVFLMQAGFMAFEVGLARPHHAPAVALKNIVDWGAASFAFFLVGFAFMFGAGNSIIGWNLFALDGLPVAIDSTVTGPTFFIFQLAFACLLYTSPSPRDRG